MKKAVLLSFLCTMAMAMNAENTDISGMDNVVYIEPCTAEVRSEYTLSVKMKNSVVAEGFGFDLVLPEGITVALDGNGDPKAELSTERTNLSNTNHFDADFKLDGSLNIQAYSSKGRTISGNDGEVALITIQISGDMALGTYPIQLKNIAISDANSVTYTVDLVETSIEIVNGGSQTILDETSTSVPEATDKAVNIKVLRTIKAGEWSTICLPFAMTAGQVTAAFGNEVKVGDFTGCTVDDETEDVKVNFAEVTAIAANHPYIIKVKDAISEFTVEGVDIAADDAVVKKDKSGRKYNSFIGNYENGLKLEDGMLFLNGNKFYFSKGETTMKAFRAYFDLDAAGAYYGSRIALVVDETTGIGTSLINHEEWDNAIYNLKGQRVEKPGKGIYIVNGKKVKK